MAEVLQKNSHPSEEGILLYYKYLYLGEDGREAVRDWYENACKREGLRGRIRVAMDGVNCTLGGDAAALRRHIVAVKHHETIKGAGIDFKLSVSQGARNSQAAIESGFTTLSVKAVKEVVSLGNRGAHVSPLQCGRHVTPQEFHDILRDEVRWHAQHRASLDGNGPRSYTGLPANSCEDEPVQRRTGLNAPQEAFGCGGVALEASRGDDSDGPRPRKDIVLLDVRNVYETSIGHFSAHGVQRLDPQTRQFSDLPAWVDENIHRLRGKRVLMYCTGGVRCEKASALIRQECEATSSSDTEILQLAGGIERYLEAYPGSGRVLDDQTILEEPERIVNGVEAGDSHGAGVSKAEQCDIEPLTSRTLDTESRGGDEDWSRNEAGFFRGKNFVFDERVSVPNSPVGGGIIGRCLLCWRPWDDYGNRARCCRCRMLILVCDSCVERQKTSPSRERVPLQALEAQNVEATESPKQANGPCFRIFSNGVDKWSPADEVPPLLPGPAGDCALPAEALKSSQSSSSIERWSQPLAVAAGRIASLTSDHSSELRESADTDTLLGITAVKSAPSSRDPSLENSAGGKRRSLGARSTAAARADEAIRGRGRCHDGRVGAPSGDLHKVQGLICSSCERRKTG